MGEFVHWGSNHRKKMSNNKVDKPGLQHHLAGQIQITRCSNEYLNDEWVKAQMT